MSNVFHKNFVDDDNHALTAVTYADITARDADTDFQVTANLDKMVRVDSPVAYFILASLGPTVWTEASSVAGDTFAEVLSNGNTSGGTDVIISTGDDLLVTDHMTVGSAVAPLTDVSLYLSDPTNAFLVNRGTQAQRDAITPTEGMQYHNLDVNDLEFYNGTAWQSMGSGDVVGPASSTDNAIARYNGIAGTSIQNSSIIINDANELVDVVQLGIGTSTPDAPLNIESSTTRIMHLEGSAVSHVRLSLDSIATGGDDWEFISTADGDATGGGNLRIRNVDTSAELTFLGTERLGIGTTAPAQSLHIDVGGTSLYAGAQRGILISDETGPRVVFEDTGAGVDQKSMAIENSNELLKVIALNDDGSSVTLDNILVIERDGNIGIGEGTPQTKLHITESDTTLTADAGSNLIVESADATNYMNFLGDATADQGILFARVTNPADGALTYNNTTQDMSFQTSNAVRMTLDDTGNLGIGTTGPNQQLHVLSSGASTATSILNRGILITDSVAPSLVFEDAGETADDKVMRIAYNDQNIIFASLNDAGSAINVDNILVVNRDGNVGIGTATPDEALTVLTSNDEALHLIGTNDSGVNLALDATNTGGDEWKFTSTADANAAGSGKLLIENVDTSAEFVITDTGSVGIGTAFPTGSSVLDIVSTTQGSRPAPRMTTAQADAISTPASGLLVDNTTTNTLDRFNGTQFNPLSPTNTIYVTDADDFPAAVSGVITLEPNTIYQFYNDDPSSGAKSIILSDRIELPDTGGVLFQGGIQQANLVYVGTGTFITSNTTFTGGVGFIEVGLSAPNGTLFDLDGQVSLPAGIPPGATFNTVGLGGTDTLGTIKVLSTAMSHVGLAFNKNGLVFDGVEELLMDNCRFLNWQNEVDSVFITVKNTLRFPKINGTVFDTNTNETVFDIQPSIDPVTFVTTPPTFIIQGNSFSGGGTLYKDIADFTITGTINVPHSGTISAVAAAASGQSIFTDTAHGLAKGEVIVQSGFASETQYNGTFEVMEVIDADTYRLQVMFTATDTGSWDSDRIQFAVVNTTIAIGDGVEVTGTTDYNGGYRVLGRSGTAAFMNGTFVSSQSGSLNKDSLTEVDPIMRVEVNAGMPDSMTTAQVLIEGNALNTPIPAVDALVLISTTSPFAAETLERIELDFPTGVSTYTGLEEITVKIDGNITLEPATATKDLETTYFRQDAVRNTVTFTNGTNLINETATTLFDGNTISFNANAGTLPTELREDIVYFVVSQLTNSFQVAYTSAGAAITFTDDGSGTNTYARTNQQGSSPALTLGAGSPATLVPQALAAIEEGDSIYPVVSNKTDAVDILVSKAYTRIAV